MQIQSIMLIKLLILIVISTISSNLYCMAAATDAGWLKVCEKGESYDIESPVCSKGIWLEEPKVLDCICAKGVWILSSDFCDKKWTLVVGNGHCFQIPDKVRSIKFIGRPDKPFASSTFTGPMDLAELVQISGGSYSSHINYDASVVIGINPKYPVQRIDKSICLTKGNETKPVHIYRNSDKKNQWKTMYNTECSTMDSYTHHLDMGELYRDDTVVPADIAIGKCQAICFSSISTGADYSQQGRSLLSRFNLSVSTPLMMEMRESGKIQRRSAFANDVRLEPPFSVQPGSPGEKKLECLTNRAQITQDPRMYEIEVKEQTVRMIGAHLKPLLFNVSAFEVNTNEYQYFKKATKIFVKSCPGEGERNNITAAISRMWGFLVSESQDKFTHMESPDNDTHARLLDLLAECTKISLLPNFNIQEIKVQKNATTCLMNVTGATGAFYNGTDDFAVNDTLPDYLKFNSDKHDLVIETAWKIILVMYYRCANVFSKEASMELSYLMEKLQSFFNDKIIKRWTDNQHSWKIYSFIFYGYDLEAYHEAVDRCLGFSKELSEIPNWLSRPKIPCSENDLSSSRPKRSIETNNNLQKVWDSTGYCIRDFSDPVTKLNYKPEKGCSVQRKIKLVFA